MTWDFRTRRGEFLTQHNITREEWERAELSWDALADVAEDHIRRTSQLQNSASYPLAQLQSLSDVHSVKSRVKSPESLVAKLIRKRVKDETDSCDVTSYRSRVTDLAGIRALHLFKKQWKPIHEFVKGHWDLHETPFAYVRRGDASEVQDEFRAAGLEVKENPLGYRSVHYLLEFSPGKELQIVELQVRTLFEEAWSEIDHRVRYPRHSDDPVLGQFLRIFNGLAGSADEMGTYIEALREVLTARATEAEAYRQKEEAFRKKEGELKGMIATLEVRDAEQKQKVQEQVRQLSEAFRETTSGLQGLRLNAVGSTSPFDTSSGASYETLTSRLGLSPTLQLTKTCNTCGKPFNSTIGILASDTCPECMVSGVVMGLPCSECGSIFPSQFKGLITSRPICPKCGASGKS